MKKVIVFCCLAVSPGLAHAYLDPGSGNALVYLFISLGGACVYFLKNAFYKVMALFGKKVEPSGGPKADVILFSEGPTYWFTFKPLIEELLRRKVPFQYLSLDVKDPGLTIDNPLMQSRFLGFGAGAYARAAACEGKIFIATTPNIGSDGYPLPRPKKVKTMVHVSHTVGDITYLKKGSLDHYDVNLDIAPWCEKRMRMVESNRDLKKKDFHSVGLLYLDELRKSYTPKSNATNEGRITVLVAPSWGDKNCLKVHNEHFITDLLKAGFRVIYRPHPQSFRFDSELLNRVIEKNSAYEGFVLDREIDSRVHMKEADILISDSSSFRFDFAFLQRRPVITMLVPTGNLSSFEGGDLGGPWETDVVPRLGAVVRPDENVDLPKLVREVVAKPTDAIDVLHRELVSHHGEAARHIVDWIEKKLAE